MVYRRPVSSLVPEDRPVGWGVLAPGRIAHTFVTDLALVPDARLVAVGSRSAQRSAAFAAEHAGPDGPATAHGSYEALVADERVDVVYVASPHALHLEHVRLALEAGKHVLVEKPVTLDAADAEEMVRLAGLHDRFLMEAMWTACHPVVRAVAGKLASGDLGTPRQLRAELGFRVTSGPEDRLLDPALGAGALLDMGIYPLTFAHLMLGEATSLTASAVLSPSGIDLDVAVTGRYAGGALATLTASMTSWSDRSAAIATDLGRVEMTGQFHHPDGAVFIPYDDGSGGGSGGGRSGPGDPHPIEVTEAVIGRGYGNEAAEVVRCLRAGLRESPLVPHAQTVTLLRQLDDVRSQVGVHYPR